MTGTPSLLDALKKQRPEWEPWLRVVEVALRTSEEPLWSTLRPERSSAPGFAPWLSGATLRLPGAVVGSYVDRLLGKATRSGTSEMATLDRAAMAHIDPLALFGAALCQDLDGLAHIAVRCGAHPDALQAVAALVPVPWLQACARSVPPRRGWVEPYCPVCGSWPAFTEIRGIERSRSYRCARCGSEWHTHGLSCPFCATTDHRELVRLVPADPGAASAVEACRKCGGYVKTFNRLQGCGPAAVMLEDLRSVALDLAALEQGYSRPAKPAYALDVTVAEATSTPRAVTR